MARENSSADAHDRWNEDHEAVDVDALGRIARRPDPPPDPDWLPVPDHCSMTTTP